MSFLENIFGGDLAPPPPAPGFSLFRWLSPGERSGGSWIWVDYALLVGFVCALLSYAQLSRSVYSAIPEGLPGKADKWILFCLTLICSPLVLYFNSPSGDRGDDDELHGAWAALWALDGAHTSSPLSRALLAVFWVGFATIGSFILIAARTPARFGLHAVSAPRERTFCRLVWVAVWRARVL